LLFLKGADTSQWEVLKMNEPDLEKAMDTLQYLSQDSDARRLYEARQKYLHDEASMVEGAKSAGVIEGKLQVARNLLAMGMDFAAVAKATGLSEGEIKSIKL
jgi:predicted transposase/invertase (TIGR01784 family)